MTRYMTTQIIDIIISTQSKLDLIKSSIIDDKINNDILKIVILELDVIKKILKKNNEHPPIVMGVPSERIPSVPVIVCENNIEVPVKKQVKSSPVKIINDVDYINDNFTRVFKTLKKNNLDEINKTDEHGRTKLYNYAHDGDLYNLKKYIKLGADVNKERSFGATPLYAACLYQHAECVKELLLAGADVNKDHISGKTPFEVAFESKNDDIISMLIKYR